MPFYKKIALPNNTSLYLWKITEDLDFFRQQVSLNENSKKRLLTMKSESHQKGFLAVRMLLQHLNFSDFNLNYDASGKPYLYGASQTNTFLKETPITSHISISHSHDFSALAFSRLPIGIDIELIKDKTLKIASRYMDINHLEQLTIEKKLEKATVIWGVKESVFKIKNNEGISFLNHIQEDAFNLEDKKTIATLKFNGMEETFEIYFDTFEQYVFVCAMQNDELAYE
ncbi:phosphopantetheinyl transferase [Flavobacterium aciduliphilum]|uniref:Phosphopantetheinyl transferase n=2 Tax=Flavobacterium aciduliphilum TaxID=1101402 RepID=A0A328YEQ3_9FLAO|nr:phosphopantetheinyl transferase [Flavobacterium aciduliphilum]